MKYLLIDEGSDETQWSNTLYLDGTPIWFLELNNKSVKHYSNDIRKFAIDNGDKGCKNIAIVYRCHLGFKDRSSEEATATDKVTFEKLQGDTINILDINFINRPIDAPS